MLMPEKKSILKVAVEKNAARKRNNLKKKASKRMAQKASARDSMVNTGYKPNNKKRDFLDIDHFEASTLREIFELAKDLKNKNRKLLDGKQLAQIYEKPSTRTRVSFEVGMNQLGGGVITMLSSDMQLGRGENIADTAKVLSRYVDIIMLRAHSHGTLLELAEHSRVPVINGLTDFSHPCQIMADIMTYEEHKGSIKGAKIAWVGDGNNVLNSWVQASAKLGFELAIACPSELLPSQKFVNRAIANGAKISIEDSPTKAVKKADCVVTDTWLSMGDKDPETRRNLLVNYQVNSALMEKAKRDAIFMHCLPAHRGEEVSASVLDGAQSVVWDEAENRLHVQKAIMAWCLGSS